MARAAPLLSADWYRVAFMRPRLRAGVRVSRQRVRGETWYVLTDPVSGRHHRFNDIAYSLIASCDGQHTLDEVWAARVDASGDRAPTQSEAIQVFAQAFAANLFVGDVAPDATAIIRTQARSRQARARAAVNPLAFKIPLWDPDRFLDAQLPHVRWLLGKPALGAAAVLIALGALLLLVNLADLAAHGQSHLASGRLLLALWLVYPLIKALHEAAHAFMVKRFGGEVHEVGITLLMLTPVPYVDASASVAFDSKHQRALVALAGILVEAALASVALVMWLLLEPGLARDIALAVVLVGGMSTLVVNANPLMRFDGYHALCDLLELPNLAQRSTRYWRYLLARRLLQLPRARFGPLARGERPWLLGYAPLAWCWRAAVLLLLALMLAGVHAAIGLAALVLSLWWLLGLPLLRALRWIASSAEAAGHRPRAALAITSAAAVVVALAVALPLPQRSHAPGVVWLPDEAMLRAGSEGFLDAVLASDGEYVAAGTPIARLANDPLRADLARVAGELERMQVERATRFESDAMRTRVAEDEIERLARAHAQLSQRVAQLELRAASAGRVALEPRRRAIGAYVPQGELIGHVMPDAAPLVRVLVRNEDVALVRERPGPVRVTLAHAAQREWLARLESAVPQATSALPTAALGEPAGGPIAVDSADTAGTTAREPRFQVDLRLPRSADARIGARAMVTFHHGDATAAEQLMRFARQSFLRYFER